MAENISTLNFENNLNAMNSEVLKRILNKSQIIFEGDKLNKCLQEVEPN